MRLDRHGFDFDQLIELQNIHLRVWGEKLLPRIAQEVREYAARNNVAAESPDKAHRVYRGQDLIEIIRQWPDLKAPYPPSEDVL